MTTDEAINIMFENERLASLGGLVVSRFRVNLMLHTDLAEYLWSMYSIGHQSIPFDPCYGELTFCGTKVIHDPSLSDDEYEFRVDYA